MCAYLPKISDTRLCQSISWVCCSFQDYLNQLKKKQKILRDWVHTSVARGYLENCSKPGETFTQSCAEKYEGVFALYSKKFDLVYRKL